MDDLNKLTILKEWYIQKCAEERKSSHDLMWVFDLAFEALTLRDKVISGFYEDVYPHYTQGMPTHELQEIMTAKEANGLINKLKQLGS